MILTSSQVSVAASSGIVLFFTTALFISGCIIQQRTFREIREAIQYNAHPPKPKIFLPDRFRQTTTELDDGTIVALDDPKPAMVEIKPTVPESLAADGGSRPKSAPLGTPPDGEAPQKPIDRAERRRKIREEMQRLAQIDTRDNYRRRFW